MRGKRKYKKFDQAHKDWLELQRTGVGYETGMAVAARKNLRKPSAQNPKGTPKESLRCEYYPQFCNTLGHRDAQSKECDIHGTTDEEKEAAKKSMMDKAVAEEMNCMRVNSEWQNYEFYVSLTFLILFVHRCFFR